MNIIKDYLKKFYKVISKPEIRILPGNLAFFLMLSLVPLLTIAGIIFSNVSIFDNIVSFAKELIPSAVVYFLTPFFSAGTDGYHVILFLLIGFVVASNGAHAIILASNALYKTEGSGYLIRRIKAIFLTIILMLLFLFALIVLAFGNIIVKFILDFAIFKNISSSIYAMFVWLKWPIAFIIVFFMVKALYTMAPDKKIASKYVNKGALFTTFGWLFTTSIYSFYANNIADYSRFYGSISSIAILMIWLYFISYIFVVGIAINTSYYELEDEKGIN